jgi:hypothetical protein
MKIFGVSFVTIVLFVAALLIGRAWGSNIPLINNVAAG